MKNYSVFLILVIGMFMVGCNSFMIEGLLPQIGKTLGQSIVVVAQGISLFSLGYFLAAPICFLCLSTKSIKFIMHVALTVFILGNIIVLNSKITFLFLIGMSLAGIGNGIFTPLCVTIANNLSDVSFRGRVSSLVWGANSAGVVLGVPLGFYLSSYFNWQLSIAYLIFLGLIVFIGFSFQDIDIKLPISSSFRDNFCLLANKKIMLVIGMTCCISTACLGLYSYVAFLQSDASYSLAIILFTWGLGGFIGSSLVGVFIDQTKQPQIMMAFILVGLILTFISLPFTKYLPHLGLIPFFMWGALGWATTVPQQYILFGLQETQETTLAALNTSAVGLGSVFGTVIGGAIIASGFNEIHLPFLAAALLLVVLLCQLMLIKKSTLEY